MTINRHTDPRQSVDRPDTSSSRGRVPDDALLDAARACVLTHGVRHTTLVRVARAAGVSRMTLYRRFSDIDSILTTLLTRELDALLCKIEHQTAAAATARKHLVDTTLATVRTLSRDPLMHAVLERDPGPVLPSPVGHPGGPQRLAEQRLQALVRRGHRDGSIRLTDTAAQVRAVMVTVRSFTLFLASESTEVSTSALLHELRHMLDSALENKE